MIPSPRPVRRLLVALALGTLAGTLAPTTIGAAAGPAAAAVAPASFDLQAHRGGRGLTVENTLPAFDKALRLGVTTLELDTAITADGHAVVSHNYQVTSPYCVDTGPATPGDPEYPYVGKNIHDLTLDQVRTLDCGQPTSIAGQEPAPGTRMPTLSEVLWLVRAYRAPTRLNIETKVFPNAPTLTASPQEFVDELLGDVAAAGLTSQVSIQSFYWRTLRLVQQQAPSVETVALVDPAYLEVGKPGASPWLDGIDVDSYGGDPAAAAAALGADALSPPDQVPSSQGPVDFTTPALVASAHDRGLLVVPYTVNDPARMRLLIDRGVDGLISDYPDRLRTVVGEAGLTLPAPAVPPAQATPVTRAHSNDDERQARPLIDAYLQGFTSIEVDVWLVDGEVRAGTTRSAAVAGRDLESLYLAPLEALARMNRGRVLPGQKGPTQLLLDVRSGAVGTYAAIDAVLRRHPQLLTSWQGGTRTTRAVSVVVSGNRDLATMRAQTQRRASYDARQSELTTSLPASLAPTVGVDWTAFTGWRGTTPLPTAVRDRLKALVAKAHAQGRRVRFYATPDAAGTARTRVWTALRSAGVDHLGSSDLRGLRGFLTR